MYGMRSLFRASWPKGPNDDDDDDDDDDEALISLSLGIGENVCAESPAT